MRRDVELTQATQAHLRQAQQNFRLYHRLCAEGEFPDWTLTLMFYTVLHLVQAYVRQYGDWIPQTHEERRDFIQEDPRLQVIQYDYRRLHDQSRNVRYNLRPITFEEVQNLEGRQFGRIVGVLRRNGIDLHAVPAPEAGTP